VAANNFIYDTRDLKFVLKEWLDLDKLLGFEAYRDYYGKDDVDNSAAKASPTDKIGIYKIKGTKIFITSADNDIVENFIHLVLARVEGSREGTGGLSLFMVPRIWVNEDGSLGKNNDVTTVGIEHKMGLRGSATCTMAYGENDDCYGILFGTPPGEDGKGQGMAQMFKMMNEERLVTGLMALGLTAEAYYNSLAYARERVQGTKSTDPKGPRVRIIEHEDVRRMLMRQKACVEAMRALILKTYYYSDLSHDSSDPEERAFADGRFQISNPLCKAYVSDMVWPLIAEAIQVYGGYGFTEEYPCAQLARDSKILSIWEGTNYIQANDLVGRKFTMGKGKLLASLLEDMTQFITDNKNAAGFGSEFTMLTAALADFQKILGLLNEYTLQGQKTIAPLFSTRILHATAMMYCATLIMDQGLLAARKLAEVGEDHFDANFYKGKIASAKYYVMNELPQIFSIRSIFAAGDTTALDIPEEALG
jgi:alkylation response protein AidB-like acyl-CoA dehydrogenase